MERHSSMFISEIPVRCTSSTDNGEKTIKWITDLNSHTTAQDVIKSILPSCDSTKYSLYIYTGRNKQMLNDSSRIYKVVGKINREKSSQRLLFEIRSKKRVRFADEILIQNIVKGQCLSNEKFRKNIIETISIPKKNFIKRSSLRVINENISRSSSESGISSNSDDFVVPTMMLETLV